MAFETQLTVRFGDCDPAGIAYYPRIYHYLHVAFEEFWQQHVGVSYAELCNEDGIGFPTVHLQTDFQRPIRFGDSMNVQLWVANVGRASVNFEYRVFVKGNMCVVASSTVAAVDMSTLRPVQIPDRYRGKLLDCARPEGI